MGRMTQLLHCETICFEPLCHGFTDLGSIPGQYKIMNVHEGIMVLYPTFSNA